MGNDWLLLCILTSRYLQNCHFSLWLLYSCHCCDISKKPLTNHYSLGRGQCRQWWGVLPCKQCICIVISPPILPLLSIALIVICREGDINTVLIYTWQASMNIWNEVGLSMLWFSSTIHWKMRCVVYKIVQSKIAYCWNVSTQFLVYL